MKKITKPTIAAFLVLSMAVAGCTAPESPETQTAEQAESVTPVQVETVRKGVINTEAGITAKLAPSEEVQVSPKISGKITSLPVALGDYVSKGQVLFKIDEEDLLNSVKQAEAAYAVAQANLRQAGSSTDQGLVQAQNALKQAEQALEDAKINHQRMQQLFAQGAISAQQLEQAKTQLTNAQTAYDTAKQNLLTAQQKTGLQVSEASVKQAQVNLQTLRDQLANATVTAPISGFISQVNGAVGQMAGQQPVVTIVQTNPLLVKANLSEADVTKVKVGTPVKVRVQTTGQELEAKVTAVSPVMDASLKAYPVEITIPNPNNELKSDMVVTVTFPQKLEDKSASLVVSRQAVFEKGGKQYVYKLEGDVAKQVEVTTGEGTSDEIEIVSGLQEGDTVVVRGQTLLHDGAKVSIQETKE